MPSAKPTPFRSRSGAISSGTVICRICAPVSSAIQQGTDRVTPVKARSLAKSLAIGNPADGRYAARAVRASGGWGTVCREDEIQDAMARGQDLLEGYRYVEKLPAKYEVDGILLPRPFKIVRIGPVRVGTSAMSSLIVIVA